MFVSYDMHYFFLVKLLFALQLTLTLFDILFLQGEGEDYIIIALKEGHLTVGVSLGSGSYQADLRPKRGNVRFDDNHWHYVTVVRETREVNHLNHLL